MASKRSLSLLRGVSRLSSAPGRCSRTVRNRPTSLVTRCSRAVVSATSAVYVAPCGRLRTRAAVCHDPRVIDRPALPLHLGAATLLRISAEGMATALVLTVEARTGRAAAAGFLQTGVTLPYVLSGPLIGHALDRIGRPRPLVVALTIGYAAMTALLLLIAGRSPLALALLVAAVIGCTEPVVVALTSLLPRYVPADRLSRAYGLEASSYNVAAIIGPGLAAAVATAAGGTYPGAAIVASATVGLL